MSNPNIRIVTSVSNEEIKFIRSLERRKERKETGLFIADGLRHTLEGVANGWELVKVAYNVEIAGKPEVEKVRRACLNAGGMCLEVNNAVLEKLSHKDNPQQVIGIFKQKLTALNDLKAKKCIVALEQVRDPGNLGTIIRTIDSVGADSVVLIDQCCDPFSVEAARASMGSMFAVPIAQSSKADFISFVKGWKGSVIGTHLARNSVDYREPDYKTPVLLVMGNEQSGLTPELADSLETLVKLPMNGKADSLNLAIATGVMLYKILES